MGEGGAGPAAVVPTLRGRPGERRTGEGGALSELELIFSKSNDSLSLLITIASGVAARALPFAFADMEVALGLGLGLS